MATSLARMPPAKPLVAAASQAVTLARPKPLVYKYEAYPKPRNCAGFVATRIIAADPRHPLYLRTNRRLNAFDPHILHWRVSCKMSFSKRKIVRDRAKHRLHAAIIRELHQVGLDPRGRPLPGQTSTTPLRGAFCVTVPDDILFATSSVADLQAIVHATFQSLCRTAESKRQYVKPA